MSELSRDAVSVSNSGPAHSAFGAGLGPTEAESFASFLELYRNKMLMKKLEHVEGCGLTEVGK